MDNLFKRFFIFLCIKGVFNWMPDRLYLKMCFWIRLGYHLNLSNPITFNEKIQWLKLYRCPLYSQETDKYEVRDFVKNNIGQEYLVPLIGVWDNVDEINFNSLPNKFVLKCTHDSQSIRICRDKSQFDIIKTRNFFRRRITNNYFYGGREYQYKNIKPRIVAEQYLEEDDGQLRDYKFFCFNGIPKMVMIVTGRNNNETCFDFFDMDFHRLPIRQFYPNYQGPIKRPQNFELMINLSKSLTKNYIHCRADFYEVHGRVYFGELTFTHFCGFVPFEPKEWDNILGSWIELPKS